MLPSASRMSLKPQKAKLAYQKNSLNYVKRKQDHMRIQQENNRILSRLQKRSSTYDSSNWAQDRKRNEKILSKICLYPPILGKKSHRTKSTGRSGEAKSFTAGLKLPQPGGRNM